MEIYIYEEIFKQNYPDIRISEFKLLKKGNDFITFEIDNSLIIKFPVSKEIEKRIPFEIELLNRLKNKLQISIPLIKYNCLSNQHTFIGYEKILGVPFDITIRDESYSYNLGIFSHIIRELSSIRNTEIDTKNIVYTWNKYYFHLLKVIRLKAFKSIDVSQKIEVAKILNENYKKFVENSFAPKLIHADLKNEHLICNIKDNHIVGLIDWNDATFGDISFEFARILTEFGIDFYKKLIKENSQIISRNDANRIAFYSILIPFNNILDGINNSENDKLKQGISKLSASLYNYEEIKKTV